MRPIARLTSAAAGTAAVFGLHVASSSPAAAQSNPADFDFVYNIGDVPPGSIFDIADGDIPGVVVTTGTEVGDDDLGIFQGYISPTGLQQPSWDILGSDSQLNLFDGGVITRGFSASPSNGPGTTNEANIFGGTVGEGFNAFAGSTINILDGAIDDDFTARSGSTINVSGGSFGENFQARESSTVHISGGVFGRESMLDIHLEVLTGSVVNISGGTFIFPTLLGGVRARSGSTVNISGGFVNTDFLARPNSMVNITGGVFGRRFDSLTDSTVNLSGDAFRFNGSAVDELSAGFGDGVSTDLFSGVLADGSVFIFGGEAGDGFAPGTLTLQTADVAPSANPGVLSSGFFAKGVRAGESLTVTVTGSLGENFAVVGGTLNVEGGSVGNGLEVVSSQVNISGGTVGERFNVYAGSTLDISGGDVGEELKAFNGSTVNISGGTVGGFAEAFSGSTVNITGGKVGNRFTALSGSTVNISGGEVDIGLDALPGSIVNVTGGSFGGVFDALSTVNISGGDLGNGFTAFPGSTVDISGGDFGLSFDAFSGSTVNISGGTFGLFFSALSDSTVNLFGKSFFLDGVELDGLVVGEAFTITDREVVLSGVFADGSDFDFDLALDRNFGSVEDVFSSSATLTVTLVPEPTGLALLGPGGLLVMRRRRDRGVE